MGFDKFIPGFLKPKTVVVYDDDEEEDVEEEDVDEIGRLLQHASAPSGMHGKVMSIVIFIFATFGTIALWWLLGTGNGEFFNNFAGFSLTPPAIGAYLMGLTLEGAGVVMIVTAGREWHKRKYGLFLGALSGAIFLSALSFYTQYALLTSELVRGMLSFPDQELVALPFIHNVTGILMLRALAPALVNFYIVFLLTDYQPDIVALMQQRQKIQQQVHAYRHGEASMELTEAAHEATMQVIRATTEQLAQRIDKGYVPVVQPQKQPKPVAQPQKPPQQLPPPTQIQNKQPRAIPEPYREPVTKKTTSVDELLKLMNE